jgi:flagellin
LTASSNVNVTIGSSTPGGPGTLSSVLSLTGGTTSYVTNSVRQSAASSFDALRTQIDQAVTDASFEGVNLLTGDTLTVTFNETGTSKVTLTGANISASGLGVAASTNGFQLDSDINAALADITDALTSLRATSQSFSTSSSLVAAREDFTQSMVNTLNAGADDLVAADVNEEGAMLLALKSRQEMAAVGMSITQGADTAVLRLLGLTG